MRFTAEIDRNANRNRKSRQCGGTRLTNVLHAIQQFSTVVDVMVGGSQSQIACALWGTVKISLLLASAISSYFDQLSTLFMRIGRTCPRYQDFALLYPESRRLQSALCEYFIVIVRLCQQAVVFLKKPFWSQLSSSILKPFESEFGSFHQDLESLASAIREKGKSYYFSTPALFTIMKNPGSKHANEGTLAGHDEVESLQARTIIGSIARQIFDHVKPNIVDTILEMRPGTVDTEQVLDYITMLLPSSSQKYFIIIDGLDECEEKESKLLLQCLKQLLLSEHGFQVYCCSRPDVFRWAPAFLEPQWNVFMPEKSLDIEEYIKDTLEQRLESGTLSLGDPTIILTIQHALRENAHGMFLWVTFQIDSICSQKTDAAILTALEDLPKDLPDTFNRILRKLQYSDTADPLFCRKIFDLLAAAQRPLTLEELREAISVKPGETKWDVSKLINDMLKLLLDSCGSLVAVDEEHLTVHFAHHSVKQHLLSEPTDSDIGNYHINLKEADLYLGDIVVTYLSFGIFDRQLTKTTSSLLPQAINYPSAILGGLSQSNFANKLAVKLLKSMGGARLDIQTQLKTAAGILDESKEQTQKAYCFLPYAQEYWLFHTKFFIPDRVASYFLWQSLPNGKVGTVRLPWKSTAHNDEMTGWMNWSLQNEHWALVDLGLVKVNMRRHHQAAQPMLEILESLDNKLTDMNARNIDPGFVLYMALYLNSKSVVLQSLRKGADINTTYGYYGTVLHAASRFGHEEVVRLLLENGANVNFESLHYSSALHLASYHGHEEIVRLLLKSGANVNSEDGYCGNALHGASSQGHEEIARLLLKNGADVNANGGLFGTAPLHEASECGREEIVSLLLDNGADANAQDKSGRTPLEVALEVASGYGKWATVRLLLDKGAIVDNKTMEAASNSGDAQVKEMVRKVFMFKTDSEKEPKVGGVVVSMPPPENEQ